MPGCLPSHCIRGWCHWEWFLQGQITIYIGLANSLTSSSLDIKRQDWDCQPKTAEKQYQENNEILGMSFLIFFLSLLDFITSPTKHLLPRQEPKHPRKLMRTVRERIIKRKVTGTRKISPLWSKRRFSIFDETFVKWAILKEDKCYVLELNYLWW